MSTTTISKLYYNGQTFLTAINAFISRGNNFTSTILLVAPYDNKRDVRIAYDLPSTIIIPTDFMILFGTEVGTETGPIPDGETWNVWKIDIDKVTLNSAATGTTSKMGVNFIVFDHQVESEDWIFKGVFSSVAALNSALPVGQGDWYVGVGTNLAIGDNPAYIFAAGAWQNITNQTLTEFEEDQDIIRTTTNFSTEKTDITVSPDIQTVPATLSDSTLLDSIYENLSLLNGQVADIEAIIGDNGDNFVKSNLEYPLITTTSDDIEMFVKDIDATSKTMKIAQLRVELEKDRGVVDTVDIWLAANPIDIGDTTKYEGWFAGITTPSSSSGDSNLVTTIVKEEITWDKNIQDWIASGIEYGESSAILEARIANLEDKTQFQSINQGKTLFGTGIFVAGEDSLFTEDISFFGGERIFSPDIFTPSNETFESLSSHEVSINTNTGNIATNSGNIALKLNEDNRALILRTLNELADNDFITGVDSVTGEAYKFTVATMREFFSNPLNLGLFGTIEQAFAANPNPAEGSEVTIAETDSKWFWDAQSVAQNKFVDSGNKGKLDTVTYDANKESTDQAILDNKTATENLEINKIANTEKGIALGVAPLNSDSKLDTIYLDLPSIERIFYSDLSVPGTPGSNGILKNDKPSGVITNIPVIDITSTPQLIKIFEYTVSNNDKFLKDATQSFHHFSLINTTTRDYYIRVSMDINQTANGGGIIAVLSNVDSTLQLGATPGGELETEMNDITTLLSQDVILQSGDIVAVSVSVYTLNDMGILGNIDYVVNDPLHPAWVKGIISSLAVTNMDDVVGTVNGRNTNSENEHTRADDRGDYNDNYPIMTYDVGNDLGGTVARYYLNLDNQTITNLRKVHGKLPNVTQGLPLEISIDGGITYFPVVDRLDSNDKILDSDNPEADGIFDWEYNLLFGSFLISDANGQNEQTRQKFIINDETNARQDNEIATLDGSVTELQNQTRLDFLTTDLDLRGGTKLVVTTGGTAPDNDLGAVELHAFWNNVVVTTPTKLAFDGTNIFTKNAPSEIYKLEINLAILSEINGSRTLSVRPIQVGGGLELETLNFTINNLETHSVKFVWTLPALPSTPVDWHFDIFQSQGNGLSLLNGNNRLEGEPTRLTSGLGLTDPVTETPLGDKENQLEANQEFTDKLNTTDGILDSEKIFSEIQSGTNGQTVITITEPQYEDGDKVELIINGVHSLVDINHSFDSVTGTFTLIAWSLELNDEILIKIIKTINTGSDIFVEQRVPKSWRRIDTLTSGVLIDAEFFPVATIIPLIEPLTAGISYIIEYRIQDNDDREGQLAGFSFYGNTSAGAMMCGSNMAGEIYTVRRILDQVNNNLSFYSPKKDRSLDLTNLYVAKIWVVNE